MAQAVSEVRAVICVPSAREIPAETAESLARVYGRGLTDGTVTALIVRGDTYIDTARNFLVTHALDVPSEPTHIFWMDDDMVVPSDAVARLAAHGLPIVGGLYHQRVAPFPPVAYRRDPDTERGVRMIDLEPDPVGMIRVDGMGLGCCLVELPLYLRMLEHFGDPWWHQVSSGRGEDLHFFDRCGQMGVPVWLDCDLRCGHVRREVVSTVHYESFRRAQSRREARDGATIAPAQADDRGGADAGT